MTKNEAIKNGYTFTGHYGWDKEAIKEIAKHERKKGNKAVTVFERGQRQDGYSVYIIKSDENIRLDKIEILERNIKNRENDIESKEIALNTARAELQNIKHDLFLLTYCEDK